MWKKLAFFALSIVTSLQAQDLILKNGRFIDPDQRQIVVGSLWIQEGRLRELSQSSGEAWRGEIVDLKGRFVLPGLVDLHTHSFGNMSPAGPPQYLGTPGTSQLIAKVGVVAFLDLFNDEKTVFGQRAAQRRAPLQGAYIAAAGPCLTATDGHCSEYGVPTRLIDTPAMARQQITELAEAHPDVVKIVYDHAPGRLPTISKDVLREAIKTARELNLKTIIHVGTWEDVRDAAELEASAVTHIPYGRMPADLPALLKSSRTAVIPTLTVHSEMLYLSENPDLLEEPLLRAVASEELLAAYRNSSDWPDGVKRWLERQKETKTEIFQSVAALAAAGVRIFVGTDAGNVGVFQGFSVHREMELLSEAGLGNWQVLQAGTTAAGEFLGLELGFEAGDEAHLVVLEESPLEDISNTQKIHSVYIQGRPVSR